MPPRMNSEATTEQTFRGVHFLGYKLRFWHDSVGKSHPYSLQARESIWPWGKWLIYRPAWPMSWIFFPVVFSFGYMTIVRQLLSPGKTLIYYEKGTKLWLALKAIAIFVTEHTELSDSSFLYSLSVSLSLWHEWSIFFNLTGVSPYFQKFIWNS